MRDNQQAKLYRAETAWARSMRKLGTHPDYFKAGLSEDELRDFVVGLAPVAKKLGLVKLVGDARPKAIEVRDRLAKRTWEGSYTNSTQTVLFKRGKGTSKQAAVHELAHHLTTNLVPSHGAEFARNQLALIHALLGPEAAQALEAAYDAEHVIYRASHQQAAAWKQVVRLRSDSPRGWKLVPVTNVVIDLDEAKLADWSEIVTTSRLSGSLGRLRVASFDARSSHAGKGSLIDPTITFVNGSTRVEVLRSALRYVEGPMVRAR